MYHPRRRYSAARSIQRRYRSKRPSYSRAIASTTGPQLNRNCHWYAPFYVDKAGACIVHLNNPVCNIKQTSTGFNSDPGTVKDTHEDGPSIVKYAFTATPTKVKIETPAGASDAIPAWGPSPDVDDAAYCMLERNSENFPSPKGIFLKGVNMRITVKGDCEQTHVRFLVLRQKKQVQHFNKAGTDNELATQKYQDLTLPSTSRFFGNISDPTSMNVIDRNAFQIYKDFTVKLDSATGVSATGTVTTLPSTARQINMRYYLPINKLVRPIDTLYNQDTMTDSSLKTLYTEKNLYASSNYFLMVCCDADSDNLKALPEVKLQTEHFYYDDFGARP